MKTSFTLRARFIALAVIAQPSIVVAAPDYFEPNDSQGAGTRLYPQMGLHVLNSDAAPPAKDADWYQIYVLPNRSYEFLVMKRGAYNRTYGQFTTRHAANGTLLQAAVNVAETGFNTTSLLSWMTGADAVYEGIKVEPDIAVSQSLDTSYFMRYRETTLYCPRFNNTNSQVSVLIVQGANGAPPFSSGVSLRVHAFDESGTLLSSIDGFVGHQGNFVLSLPSASALQNQKGNLRIAHTAGWDGIKAKLVALEPATGFTFDTPCEPRKHD